MNEIIPAELRSAIRRLSAQIQLRQRDILEKTFSAEMCGSASALDYLRDVQRDVGVLLVYADRAVEEAQRAIVSEEDVPAKPVLRLVRG